MSKRQVGYLGTLQRKRDRLAREMNSLSMMAETMALTADEKRRLAELKGEVADANKAIEGTRKLWAKP